MWNAGSCGELFGQWNVVGAKYLLEEHARPCSPFVVWSMP